MHPIQQFIILQLSENKTLRYSDLKPNSMEAAQFMYHLKQLSNAGFVNKAGNAYSLTPSGVQYIDKLNEHNLLPFSYPRIAMALIYSSSSKGILLSRRSKQPGIGKTGFLLIDVPLDYSPPLKHATQEAFYTQTGYEAEFSHRADGYIRVCDKNELIANMMAHIFTATGRNFVPNSKELVWQKDVDKKDVFSSTWLVLDDLKANINHFFFEHTINLD